MKVQCDVCEKAPATVLCCADEASLCAECDICVHAANKLASKHQRVSLLYPSLQDLPHCDICQEKTGYFFCLEDRALLCRDCDFSIHSTNKLAADHKRFLVSGIRVALKVISPYDSPVSMQTCSPSQVSAPATQACQFSSPGFQVCQLSSPTTVRTQKTPRMMSTPSNMIFRSVIEEESSSRAPPSLSLPNQEQRQLQPVTPTTAEHTQLVLPVGAHPSKFVATSMNSHDACEGEMLTSQSRGGCGGESMKRSSNSEYLTETIPGWRVEELLDLSDVDSIDNFPDSGAAKADASVFRDGEWLAECDIQGLGEAVAGEVPSLPSPPTNSGVPKSTKPWGFGKSLKEPDLESMLQCDDLLVVPDIGGASSPTALSPSFLPQKRRKAASEFEGVFC